MESTKSNCKCNWKRPSWNYRKSNKLLADNNINILDISQTILQDFFTMMMLVDVQESKILISLENQLRKSEVHGFEY